MEILSKVAVPIIDTCMPSLCVPAISITHKRNTPYRTALGFLHLPDCIEWRFKKVAAKSRTAPVLYGNYLDHGDQNS